MKLTTFSSTRVLPVLFAALLPATAGLAQQQFHPRHIYNENADTKAEIREALATAAQEHKRVILDFGGNWCGDCQVLDIYFHQPPNATLLAASFILVDIDIGHYDHNVDLADKYQVPLKRGVPALAVLDSDGRLLYSQKTGEFEDMRHMDPSSVTSFLDQWKMK
jgi:thiol:disulfide interchange protein